MPLHENPIPTPVSVRGGTQAGLRSLSATGDNGERQRFTGIAGRLDRPLNHKTHDGQTRNTLRAGTAAHSSARHPPLAGQRRPAR